MPYQEGNAGTNLRAFLSSIAKHESSVGPDGYLMLYGGGHFTDFSDHPARLGWPGVRLPDEQCRAAGFKPGCVSTAAGRYQITRGTLIELENDGVQVPDFSPASQDTLALALIQKCGALEDVQEGRFDAAIEKCRKRWASMPGANYKQREHALDKWRDAYASAGGVIA